MPLKQGQTWASLLARRSSSALKRLSVAARRTVLDTALSGDDEKYERQQFARDDESDSDAMSDAFCSLPSYEQMAV
jgi:hypothetical protein